MIATQASTRRPGRPSRRSCGPGPGAPSRPRAKPSVPTASARPGRTRAPPSRPRRAPPRPRCAGPRSWPVWKSKFYGAFVLNRRVVLHAIDATPARWRGDAGSSPLDRARTAASSPRNDLVKNCRVHPTHWLISTQLATCCRHVSARRRAETWRQHVASCVEINQCVGCTRQFFTKSFLGDDAAVLARSSGEEPASPRHRAGVASMAWRTTRRFSTNTP